MPAIIQSIAAAGTGGTIVDIECHLSHNLPTIVIVGSANKAVNESRERIRGAFATSRIMLPRKRIIINLAPADIPKADSGFDLAIAVAILAANGQVSRGLERRHAFIGELGLDGRVRAVRGIIGKLLAGRARGITTFYIPAANAAQARLVPRVNLVPLETLEQLYGHLSDGWPLQEIGTSASPRLVPAAAVRAGANAAVAASAADGGVTLGEIAGQPQAKRALEIAAAAGHNLLLSGPPGTGKSMLAKALKSLLPPLNREEMLEVTQLHSLTGHDYERLVTERPFRAPHHSASQLAIIGGSHMRPGEISLAHRGVLFLDEMPEFAGATLEALRQPLEDRSIRVVRAKETAEYPANFILVATANPCPCGYHGAAAADDGGPACRCQSYEVARYQQRLSGPILDRIDLQCTVQAVRPETLLAQPVNTGADRVLRRRIAAARQRQTRRYGDGRLNADMTNADIRRHGRLDAQAAALLNDAAGRFNLSARGYMRCIRVARTIADLEAAARVTAAHISEALAYRQAAAEQTAGAVGG